MCVSVCVRACVRVCVCVCVCVILVCNFTEATLFGRYFSICMCDGCGGWVGVG